MVSKIEFKTAGVVDAAELDPALFNVGLYGDDLSHLEWCKVPGRGDAESG